MSDTTAAYPLRWPKGWPTTESGKREASKFKCTIPSALAELKRQLGLMEATGLVLSSNYTLGNDRPKDPGVVAYFTLDGSQVAIPCDRWTNIESNVRAIALTVEAMRGIERWGAKSMIRAMFSGFKALPAKGSGIDPREVLGLRPAGALTEAEVTAAFRSKSKVYHPDVKDTGSPDKWAEIREAHDLLMAAVR